MVFGYCLVHGIIDFCCKLLFVGWYYWFVLLVVGWFYWLVLLAVGWYKYLRCSCWIARWTQVLEGHLLALQTAAIGQFTIYNFPKNYFNIIFFTSCGDDGRDALARPSNYLYNTLVLRQF